jgi:hypothetical protein
MRWLPCAAAVRRYGGCTPTIFLPQLQPAAAFLQATFVLPSNSTRTQGLCSEQANMQARPSRAASLPAELLQLIFAGLNSGKDRCEASGGLGSGGRRGGRGEALCCLAACSLLKLLSAAVKVGGKHEAISISKTAPGLPACLQGGRDAGVPPLAGRHGRCV